MSKRLALRLRYLFFTTLKRSEKDSQLKNPGTEESLCTEINSKPDFFFQSGGRGAARKKRELNY